MEKKDQFRAMVAILKAERDNTNLKIHLVSMESQKALEKAEKKWNELEKKILLISDDSVKYSNKHISKVTIEVVNLTKIYTRISDTILGITPP